MNILVAYFLGTIIGGLSAVVICLLVKFYQKKLRSPIESLPSEAFNPHKAKSSEGSSPYVAPFGLEVILNVEEECQEDMEQESELSPGLTHMPPLPRYPLYKREFQEFGHEFSPPLKPGVNSNASPTKVSIVEGEFQEFGCEFSLHLSPELPPMTSGEMIGWLSFQH